MQLQITFNVSVICTNTKRTFHYTKFTRITFNSEFSIMLINKKKGYEVGVA